MALFISIEGGEGSGKSTVGEHLAQRMRDNQIDFVHTFEPGGTELGAELRRLLFQTREAGREPVSPWSETFLFLADRTHHVETIIRPALARGAVVLCDRYIDSTIAYQAYGRRLDLEKIRRLNQDATDGLLPNLTLFLDVGVEDGLRRAHSEAQDRIGLETIDFHSRVLEGYKRQAMVEPQRIKTIDAAQPIETVVNEAWSLVEPRLISQGHSLR